MAAGVKPLENRSWAPRREVLGRPVAIHAGRTYDEEGAEFIYLRGLWHPPGGWESLPRGAIVCVVRFADFVREHPSPWFCGPWGWVIDSLWTLEDPIVCKGRQGLWPLGERLERYLRAAKGFRYGDMRDTRLE